MRVLSTILLVLLLPALSFSQFLLNPFQFVSPSLLKSSVEPGSPEEFASKGGAVAISMEDFKKDAVLKRQSANGLPRQLQFDEKGYVAFYPNLITETIIQSNGGTEIHLNSDFIDACDPNRAIEIQIEEFLTPEEIIKSDASTYSNGQLLRSAGMVRLYLKGTHFEEHASQSLKIYLPIGEVEGAQPFINKGPIDIKEIDWTLMPEENMQFDLAANAYMVQISGVTDGYLALNCDVAIDAQPYVLKVKKKTDHKASPSVVFSDGTITNLQPIAALNKPNSKNQYFLFPAIHGEELIIKDLYQNKNNQSSYLQTKIKLNKNKLQSGKAKKVTKSELVLLSEVVRYQGD